MIFLVIPRGFSLDGLADAQKILNTQKFNRRGGTRRQDHGSKGNSCSRGHNRRYGGDSWYGDDDPILATKRRIFLRVNPF